MIIITIIHLIHSALFEILKDTTQQVKKILNYKKRKQKATH